MKNKNIRGIIDLCRAVNQKAIHIYTRLFQTEEVKELKEMWGRMADEEKRHAVIWDTAKENRREYMFPTIFACPEEAKKRLEVVLEKIDALLNRWEDQKSLENALIMAYQVEYFILYPAFELLFRALEPPNDDFDPSEAYNLHVNRFIDLFIRYGNITPELALLGETLQSLWHRNKALIEIAMIDELTGLLNRRGFLIMAQELFYLAQRKKDTVAIFMMDIDGFKKINDQYGHPRGDDVLKAVGQSLKTSVRKSDVLCRYGGDEFVILFPDIRPASVQHMAEKIRKRVEKIRPRGIPITVSIGVEQGMIQNDSEDIFFLWISKADQYLYEAKANGRNCIMQGR